MLCGKHRRLITDIRRRDGRTACILARGSAFAAGYVRPKPARLRAPACFLQREVMPMTWITGLQMSLWDLTDAQKKDLHDKRVAITGCLVIPRREAIDELKRSGGIYASSVTRNTDYLVTGDLRRRRVSRKLLAARKLQNEAGKISLMTPYEFYLSLGLIYNGDG